MTRQAISTDTRRMLDASENTTPAELCAELKRCSSLEQLLLDELHDMLHSNATDEETQWVEQTLDRLCETLDREFSLMESNGYLKEVLDERPSWDHIVAGLCESHDELRADLKKIRGGLSVPLSRKRVTGLLRQQFQDWMQQFRRHKRRETDLIQEAFATDLGQGE